MEAEQALLGSVLMKPEMMYDIVDVVTPAALFSERHRIIFKTILELYGKTSPIDLLSVSARMKEKNELETAGGNVYLTELVGSVPSAGNAKHYAEIVQKKFIMRKLIEAAEHINSLGYDEATDVTELLDKAEKKMYDVTNTSYTHKFVEMKDILGEAWERLEHLHKSDANLRGVSTGFRDIDSKLSGFQKSDLIILAARPSMGKTALALDIARQTAVNHKTPVGIFSLEMSSQQLVDRMLASQSSVNSWRLRTGKIRDDDEFQRLQEGMAALSEAPIYIDDKPGSTILAMRSVARRLKIEKGLGLIIVDYLQLIMPTNSRASDSMVQQVTEISRALKGMARELDVPVLALSQLSRAVEQRGGRPRLSDLRDSGSIEQDADVVMFIHRDDKQNKESDRPNIAEILVEKHRNGPTGMVELYFDDKKTSFVSVEKSEFGDFVMPGVNVPEF